MLTPTGPDSARRPDISVLISCRGARVPSDAGVQDPVGVGRLAVLLEQVGVGRPQKAMQLCQIVHPAGADPSGRTRLLYQTP